MKNYSVFKEKSKREDFKSKTISSDLECDILIIGGGLTGISTYYHLKDKNEKIILVEQNEIGMSTTANSTGKITYLQDSIYNKLIKRFNKSKAKKYLESQLYAMDLIINTIDKLKLKCDLEKCNSYVYSTKKKERRCIKELQNFLKENDLESKIIEENNETSLVVENTYVFNPVKFIYELIRKSNIDNIYENSSVKEIKEKNDYYECTINDYKINAKKVIIASHYPYFNLPYLFPIKGSLEKSYICAGQKEIENISLISYDQPFISIRKYQNYMLFLSETHNNCSNVDDLKHFRKLIRKAEKHDLECEYMWSNIDILTNDNLPLIGRIEKNLFIATGYNTWGMTNGFLAGKVISDLVNNQKNIFTNLFNPLRTSLNSPLEITKDGFYSIKGVITGITSKNEKIEYKKLNGKDIAIYHDEEGKHIVLRKCPHMKCNLIFNDIEKTWDCPCHSSRFDINGKCIKSPSNEDITYNKNDI